MGNTEVRLNYRAAAYTRVGVRGAGFTEPGRALYFPCEKSKPLFVNWCCDSLSSRDSFPQLTATSQALRAATVHSGFPNQKKGVPTILNRLGNILGTGESRG